MRNYVITTKITAVLTSISFLITLLVHYCWLGAEAEFWCNVCLAIFGSGLLAFLTSYIGYTSEKRHTLESFSYSTHSLLHFIIKYNLSWNLEKKIDFFLEYEDICKSTWDSNLGAIYFLIDPGHKKFRYIYFNIYKPILNFNQMVSKSVPHFKLYKNGEVKNDSVMEEFVRMIEKLFMDKITFKSTLNNGQEFIGNCIINKLVRTIEGELNGRYYAMMYGKKQSERE
ncbi:MAG: hypothetical protein Q4E09_00180 [Eubacteriales bacterium]|nr:hypothetical protein [Eubacteriales bacterium]